MKQVHKLKELNRKLEDALKKIVKTADAKDASYSKIAELARDALDKRGNSK